MENPAIPVRFNGAATLSLRKLGLPRCALRRKSKLLQWGRNFIVAEIRQSPPVVELFFAASMGPQLYRCGNASTGTSSRSRPEASMGPQLYRCGNETVLSTTGLTDAELQWGRNFIVAEINGRSINCIASLSGFNGAATLSLRKSGLRRCQRLAMPWLQWGRNFIVAEITERRARHDPPMQASMGPQLYRCGNFV